MIAGGSGSGSIGRTLLRQSTTLRSFTSSTSVRLRSSKGKAHEKAKHDGKLRDAIDLYHSTDHFFPSSATLSGQELMGMKVAPAPQQQQRGRRTSIDERQKDDRNEEAEDKVRPFDEQLDWLIRSTLYEVTRKGNSVDLIHTRNAYQALARRDELQLSDLRMSNDDLEEEQGRADSASFLFQRQPFSSQTKGKDSDLPARDDPQAIQRYLVDAVRQESEWLRGTVSAENPHDALDGRAARVRDALFGTVRGRNPGLDIVRERSTDPNVQAEAKRLAQEALKRKQERQDSRRHNANRI